MIKKIGNAMKKMSQRAMWRGNRDAAMAVESHGVEGMRSNLQVQPQNIITQHTNTNTVSDVQIKSTKDSVRTQVTAATGGAVVNNFNKNNTSTEKKLGNSILDAIE